jgi:DNA-binding CsgD family transcriptional regulator
MIRPDYRWPETLGMHDLPGSLRLTSTFPFVGRSPELETLRTLMPMAEGEPRRVLLLGGAPGSGKSRLVREFAAEATSDGALVLYGACDAVVHAPYGPFVEALDHLTRVTDPVELRAAIGRAGGELTRLLPDLPTRVGDLPSPLKADPDTERHRLHTVVTDLLAAVGRVRPLLLVIEDAHWADAPTLLLLRHLARAAGTERLLLLATFRDTEAEMPQALSDTLADLRRSDEVARLSLGGFSGAEVTEFVRRAGEVGDFADDLPELARAIGDLTGGNAFLVCELWRALVETGVVEVIEGTIRLTRPLAELGTPDSVREVVSQRLSRLAPGTSDLLELAATAGAEFELALIRRAAGLAEPELLAALDEAVRSGIIEELTSRALGYRFTHELVRRALYDRLSGVRRAELHLRVGEALEGAEGRSGRALADLAHHFTAAAPFGEAKRGVEYNVLASQAATAALAFDEAAARLRAALELGIEGPSERAEVLLEIGAASHRAGKALDALEAFRSAAEIARELGNAELLVRSAIGYEDACWRPGIVDEGAAELLEEATAALGDEGSELRLRLLSGLARALQFRGDHERGAIVRTSAVELARRLQDRTGLATALVRSYWSRGTSSLEEILDMLTEAKELGEQLGNTEIRAEAMAWRVPTFVARSDVSSARRELAELSETADETAQPFMLHVAEQYGSAIALADGRLEEAEAMAQQSHEWGRLLTGRDASGSYGIQMFSLRREQGRLAELAPVIRILAAEGREQGPWRPGLAALLVELGMDREAERELSRVATGGLDGFRESLWLATLTYLTDACAAVGDETMAALVYPELEPLAGTNVMIGHLVAYYGAGDRYLGMLAATLGEWQRAEEHFERAMELNRRMSAATWLAHTAYEYARLLSERGRRDRAEALLGEAAALAERINMPALLGRIRALGSSVPRTELPDGLSAREAQILRLVAEGLSNREIGSTLFISEHTAANHIRSILRKTGCANRTEAASYAHRHNVVEG